MAAPPDQAQSVLDFLAGAETGFFVEVGPGRVGSHSAALEERGWSGVLVEPQPDLAAFLVTARSAQVFAVACVAPDRAGQSVSLRVASATGAAPYLVLVPGRTLDDILDEAEAPTPIDALIIDAAGHESAVLAGCDFDHWQPRLILLRDRLETLRAHRSLRSQGYRLIRRQNGNTFYVPADAPIRPDRGLRWRVFREYHLGAPRRWTRAALRRLRHGMAMSAAD